MVYVFMVCHEVSVLQVSGGGWSAGLGSNLGWALSSFGGAKAKGQHSIFGPKPINLSPLSLLCISATSMLDNSLRV